MRLPSLLRRTPFRLTLLFLALFVAAAGAILAYVYFASASEAQGRARADVEGELGALTAIHRTRGVSTCRGIGNSVVNSVCDDVMRQKCVVRHFAATRFL